MCRSCGLLGRSWVWTLDTCVCKCQEGAWWGREVPSGPLHTGWDPTSPRKGTTGGDGQFWPGGLGQTPRVVPIFWQEATCSICLWPMTCPGLATLGGATEVPFHLLPLELA